MQVRQTVEIIVTDMTDGMVTGHILDGSHFSLTKEPEPEPEPVFKPPLKKYKKRKRPKNKVDVWIRKNNITTFSMEDYLKDNPNDYYTRKRIKEYISKMLDDRTLFQISNTTFSTAMAMITKKK